MLRRLAPLIIALSLLATPSGTVAQNIETLFQQGNTALEQENYSEAERIFRQIIQLNPNFADAYFGLGYILVEQGKYDQGIAAYNRAIQLKPDYADAYDNLGAALTLQGKPEEAERLHRKALELGTTNVAITYYNLGVALREQGKLDEAITAYNRAIQLNPDYAITYYNLGVALREQGKLDEAIAAYNRAIQLKSDYADAYDNLGAALREQGKFEEAERLHRKALELGTSNVAITYNLLGYVLQQQGKLEEAIAEYQRAIELDPDFVPAQNNLREARTQLAKKSDPSPVSIDDRQYLPNITEEPLVLLMRSTVRIVAEVDQGASIGAGWVVNVDRQSKTAWIVTNRHIIHKKPNRQPATKIIVEFYSQLADKNRYPATIAKITNVDDNLDLAVLKVENIPDDIQPLKTRTGSIARRTTVIIIGHPSNAFTPPWATPDSKVISHDKNSDYFPISEMLAEGYSGGPVIDEKNHQVIGMMVRNSNNNDIATDPNAPTNIPSENSSVPGGVGLVYRIEVVLEQLRRWELLN